jgi:hypothetical protein
VSTEKIKNFYSGIGDKAGQVEAGYPKRLSDVFLGERGWSKQIQAPERTKANRKYGERDCLKNTLTTEEASKCCRQTCHSGPGRDIAQCHAQNQISPSGDA